MQMEILGILFYLGLQFLVGMWVARKVRSNTDYLLAGRSLGPFLATFSIFATWFGAETCIGSASRVYEEGLAGGRADPFGYAICLLITGLFIARPIWQRKLSTLADLYRQRFNCTVERVAVLIMIPSSLIWAAAQLRAFGQVVSVSSGWAFELSLIFATVVVVLYTASGGLLADVYTDLVQGLLLIAGLIILAISLVTQMDDPKMVTAAFDPSRLNPLGGHNMSWWERIDGWLVPIVGSLAAQELISRLLATRSSNIARKSTFWAAGLYLVVASIPVVFGLLGPILVPNIADPEQLLPFLAKQHLNTLGYVLFAGALVSAILSTVDSTLLAIAALFSHNLVLPMIPRASDRFQLRLARGTVILSGIFAFLLARYSEGIYEMVELASSFGSAGLVVVTMFALFTKWGDSVSALVALISGVVVQLLVKYVWEVEAPYLTTILTCIGVYWVIGLFTAKAAEIPEAPAQAS